MSKGNFVPRALYWTNPLRVITCPFVDWARILYLSKRDWSAAKGNSSRWRLIGDLRSCEERTHSGCTIALSDTNSGYWWRHVPLWKESNPEKTSRAPSQRFSVCSRRRKSHQGLAPSDVHSTVLHRPSPATRRRRKPKSLLIRFSTADRKCISIFTRPMFLRKETWSDFGNLPINLYRHYVIQSRKKPHVG